MLKRWSFILYALLLLLIFSACGGVDFFSQSDDVPPAIQMMPELAGYDVVEGETLTTYLSTVGGGAALLSGHPELAAGIALADGVASCYQEAGAVRIRLYSNQEMALEAGGVAIAG